MSNWVHPKNDGWSDVEYDFGIGKESNKKVSHILNEACHVFYHHDDGNWQSTYKEEFAEALALEFRKHSELSSRVLRSNDRIVKMVAYRAVEIIKEKVN